MKCGVCGALLVEKKTTALHDVYGCNMRYVYACGTVEHVKELAEGASPLKPIVETTRGEKCKPP